MKAAMINDVAATAMAGMALHTATLNMLVEAGALTEDQAVEAFKNALLSVQRTKAGAPQMQEVCDTAIALLKTILDE